jgi:hypothetical protein
VKSAAIESLFPRLPNTDYRVTSQADQFYNCIAWAAGEDSRWWWPAPGYYWPPQVANQNTLAAFIEAFSALGYARSGSPAFVAGFEKIAIFVDAAGQPTHAARQLPSGRWTSKLGTLEDIEHEAAEHVGGTDYGEVAVILQRGVPAP